MSTACECTVPIGVGFDTARYGHHVTFLLPDRQPATKPLDFLESSGGYQQLEDMFRQLYERHPNAHFHIRVDAAGQYATNLLTFLEALPWQKTISLGDPLRNKRYREVHFPKRKSDAVESQACARFALVEHPAQAKLPSPELLTLQEVASRLEFQVKQSTRQVNRLHNLLARVFPELATHQQSLQALWVLRMLEQYPSAQRIAQADLDSLSAIPYLNRKKAQEVQELARTSVACEKGDIVEELVRESVRDLLRAVEAEKRLEKLLVKAFEALEDENAKQILTIPGIGKRTAAILVAKIGTIDRFPTADHLVGYFGVFPEENTSGVDKDGRPLPSGAKRMSHKGNDLVRKYLWMAAQSAIRYNTQVEDLNERLRARGRRGDVALGHCMRKLLHQVFGIWKSGRAYDPKYRGSKELALAGGGEAAVPGAVPPSRQEPAEAPLQPAAVTCCQEAAQPCQRAAPEQEKAAGRKTGNSPQRKAVTATDPIVSPQPPSEQEPQNGSVDFAYLRSQITMEQVLRHMGYFDRLRGNVQRRGPCPVHGSKRDRGRTFSVHLGKNIFQCFHPPCGAAGDVIDLWRAIHHHLTRHDAALSLAQTFHLQLRPGTEKRNP